LSGKADIAEILLQASATPNRRDDLGFLKNWLAALDDFRN
jgi:hypothetical protein